MSQGFGLYPAPDHLGQAQQFYNQASGSYGAMQKAGPEPPGKTAGGALASGASMAGAGATIGSSVAAGSAGGPWGAAIGAVVGIGSYLLS